MLQQDLRSMQGYFLGIISIILVLFVPIELIMLRIFQPVTAVLLIGLFFPFIAIVFGVIGLIISLKQSTSIAKRSKIFNISAIAIGTILIILILYIFIKSGNFGGMI